MYDLIIKNGTIVTSAGHYEANIAAENSVIIEITRQEPTAEKVVDARNKIILPGIMDFHCHMRDPGFTHKEDFETGTRAATAGGVTFVCPQPNLKPVPNTIENYKMEIEAGERKSLVDFNPPASPLLYEEGWVPKLAKMGTAWFKIFQKVAAYPYSTAAGTTNTAHMYEAFKEIAKTGLYCSIHPFNEHFFNEVPHIMKRWGIPMTLENYTELLYSDDEMASAAIQLCFLAKKAGMKWYALHCWMPSYIELVRRLKTTKEMNVVASAESIEYFKRNKVYDVKRGEWAVQGRSPSNPNIWKAIQDGTIDFIDSDHAPHLAEEGLYVDDPLKANLGLPSLEWYVHLLLNEVNKGTIGLEKLVALASENGAKIFGFYPRKGTIQVGSDADFTIVDMDREWTITSDRVYTKCQINPFHGEKIKGKVTHTILRGQVIMEEGEVLGKPGYGRYIKPVKQK